MGRTFTVEIEGDPAVLIARAEALAKANGIRFSGDGDAGVFSGMGAAGSYQRRGQDLTITVDKKPIFVSWGMIEAQLKEFFS